MSEAAATINAIISARIDFRFGNDFNIGGRPPIAWIG
jgi:hypothetical protein